MTKFFNNVWDRLVYFMDWLIPKMAGRFGGYQWMFLGGLLWLVCGYWAVVTKYFSPGWEWAGPIIFIINGAYAVSYGGYQLQKRWNQQGLSVRWDICRCGHQAVAHVLYEGVRGPWGIVWTPGTGRCQIVEYNFGPSFIRGSVSNSTFSNISSPDVDVKDCGCEQYRRKFLPTIWPLAH